MGNIRYQLPGGDGDAGSARLLYVSSAVYENDWPSIPHTHHFSEFFYVRRGAGEFLVEEERFPVRQDDLVIVNPGAAHTECSAGADPLEYVVLGVEGMSFAFGEREDGAPKSYRLHNYRSQRDELRFYFGAMLRETENKGAQYELVCQNLLGVLTVLLIRGADCSFSLAPVQRASKECSLAKRYIDFHYAEDVTLEDLARLTHLNKYYLAHAFSRCYGITPINYLIEKRLQCSRELLESTDYSIAQIAQMAGFSSQSYFSQTFRRVCAVTPGAYRRTARQTGSHTGKPG